MPLIQGLDGLIEIDRNGPNIFSFFFKSMEASDLRKVSQRTEEGHMFGEYARRWIEATNFLRYNQLAACLFQGFLLRDFQGGCAGIYSPGDALHEPGVFFSVKWGNSKLLDERDLLSADVKRQYHDRIAGHEDFPVDRLRQITGESRVCESVFLNLRITTVDGLHLCDGRIRTQK